MLLRHRPPELDTSPAALSPGLEHLDQEWVTVLRWLNANKVDFLVVGPVAHAIRGELTARGPVSIVPAPYSRNYERLSNALAAQDAGLRSERVLRGADPVEAKLDAEKLARGRRWLLSFAGYDLDVESSSLRPAPRGSHEKGPAQPAGDGGHYQELLYESARYELAPGLSVEVASPEDLERYSRVGRAAAAPEFRITRNDGTRGAEAQIADASADS